jgi:hypothetical protein
MRKLTALALLCNTALCLSILLRGRAEPALAGELLARENGDTNGDGRRDISDAIILLEWLFSDGPPPVAFADGPAITPEQAELLGYFSLVDLDDGQGGRLKTLRITGANLQIVNGLGATNGNPLDPARTDEAKVNGLGNLIVGYQEHCVSPVGGEDLRTGSHNVVVGTCNSYTSAGGLVVGVSNTIAAPFACVSGGFGNTASGLYSSVTGGGLNTASARGCSVTGGGRNIAGIAEDDEEGYSTVTGGFSNSALGSYCSLTGGSSNEAEEYYSTVTGGFYNIAGEYGSVVIGGSNNTAGGDLSVVSGGIGNSASGFGASVSGGGSSEDDLSGGNTASGKLSSVSGGSFNTADGDGSSISGGTGHETHEPYEWQAGS